MVAKTLKIETTQEEIDSAKWRKTDYLEPHEYIVKKDYPELFKKLAQDIDGSPVTRTFMGKKYRYLIFNGYRYWHFQIILNRAKDETGQ